MRVIVLFDLPVVTPEDRKAYRTFRRFLIKSGFVMVQESVYSKIALNGTAARAIQGKVRENRPPAGLVQMITLTEKQYNNMEFVVGEKTGNVVDSDERLVVL